MYVRILGIAPEKTILNADGSFRAVLPIFWVYYPDLRTFLAKYEAYNGKNYGARMSWEELLKVVCSPAGVVKSTIDNPGDNFISAYIKDPILGSAGRRRYQGKNIQLRTGPLVLLS